MQLKKNNKSGKLCFSISNITADQLSTIHDRLIRYEQHRWFGKLYDAIADHKKLTNDICSNSVRRCSPVIVEGLIRMKGRFREDLCDYNVQYPVLLPSESHLTTMMIREYHKLCGRSGLNHIFTALRERYWLEIPTATIKHVLEECLVCRRKRAVPEQQIMADLLACRTQAYCNPFSHAEVDCFGPILVKQGRSHVKRYGCLFTCMSCRAIHLEVLHSLSTDSFLMTFDRFRSRREKVEHLYSDNGTNFVGANKQ